MSRMSMDPLWEWLGRTRVMNWFIETVDAWFQHINDRERERASERLRARHDDDPAPAYDRDTELVLTGPDTVLYRLVATSPWTRGSTPATCVSCLNTRGIALTWMSGHETLARLNCPCGASWCDPLWATGEATEHALSNAHSLDWDDPQVDPWFCEENVRLVVRQMRYETADDQRRQQQEGGDQ